MADHGEFIQIEFRLERQSNGADHSSVPFAVWGMGTDGRRHPLREFNDMKLTEFQDMAAKSIGDLMRIRPAPKLAFYLHLEDYKPAEGRRRNDGRRLGLRGGMMLVTEKEWLDRLEHVKARPKAG